MITSVANSTAPQAISATSLRPADDEFTDILDGLYQAAAAQSKALDAATEAINKKIQEIMGSTVDASNYILSSSAQQSSEPSANVAAPAATADRSLSSDSKDISERALQRPDNTAPSDSEYQHASLVSSVYLNMVRQLTQPQGKHQTRGHQEHGAATTQPLSQV